MKLRLLFVYSCFVLLVSSIRPNNVRASDDAYKDNACVSCHQNLPGKLSAIVQEWRQSIHFQNNVTCDGCHGGDP
ncbi:MAG: multiheme c-type cytochrome, partial [Planctomycetota bacterium]